ARRIDVGHELGLAERVDVLLACDSLRGRAAAISERRVFEDELVADGAVAAAERIERIRRWRQRCIEDVDAGLSPGVPCSGPAELVLLEERALGATIHLAPARGLVDVLLLVL